jgi:hypothetical protein
MFDEAGIAQPGWTKPATTRRPHGAFHPLEDTP